MLPAYSVYTLTLSANERRPLDVGGTFFRLFYNSSTTDVLIEVDDNSAQAISQGRWFEVALGDKFNRLVFTNQTGATITIRFGISLGGRIGDDSLTISGTLLVNAVPNTLTTSAAVSVGTSAAVALAADSNTREVVIQNVGTVDVWIGDSSVNPSTNKGTKLVPDAMIILSISADIYARVSSGTGTLTINKMTKV